MKLDWQRLLRGPWIQNAKTDWLWDELLNKALDQHGATRSSSYTAKVGSMEVWIGNWPFAYGSPHRPHEAEMMPSVKTRRRLRAMLHLGDMALLVQASTAA
jgi:hypothetical protein